MIQNLLIEATKRTPQVVFETTGNLLLRGQSFMMDANSFYQSLINWVDQLNASKVRFIIDIDYFDSSSSKELFEILKIMDNNRAIHDFVIIWNYKKDDEDIKEIGQIFEEKLKRAGFIFTEHAD
jgi:hypothetical protein